MDTGGSVGTRDSMWPGKEVFHFTEEAEHRREECSERTLLSSCFRAEEWRLALGRLPVLEEGLPGCLHSHILGPLSLLVAVCSLGFEPRFVSGRELGRRGLLDLWPPHPVWLLQDHGTDTG